jgi:hypothetical protein
MTRRLRAPSPALLISLLALFVSIGGVGYAASKIGTNDIQNKAVTKPKIDKNAVATNRIADLAVKTKKLADQAVTTDKLGDQAVTTGKLGDQAVTTGKLGDQAVTTDKLGDQAVTTGKLGSNSVRAGKLATTIRLNAALVANGSNAQVTTNCFLGEKAIGGGAEWSGAFNNAQAQNTHLVNSVVVPTGTGWRARGYNNSGSARVLTVRAICVNAG